MGYATYYTMLPVFSLVLDVELSESVVFMFPELYDSLRRGRIMSQKTFLSWLWTSVYQVICVAKEIRFINHMSFSTGRLRREKETFLVVGGRHNAGSDTVVRI